MIRLRSRGTINYGKKQDALLGPDRRMKRFQPAEQPSGQENDMANGLTQGAHMNNQQDFTNQNILLLLQKISDQLENMKNASSGQFANQAGQQAANTNMQQGQTRQLQSSQQPTDTAVSEQLQQLFSQLLQGKNTSQQTNQINQQQSEQSNGQSPNKTNSLVAQTAAQALAQAQYELSNELETSLKKLKQVISESEKLANKISNLLGEENTNQQSR